MIAFPFRLADALTAFAGSPRRLFQFAMLEKNDRNRERDHHVYVPDLQGRNETKNFEDENDERNDLSNPHRSNLRELLCQIFPP